MKQTDKHKSEPWDESFSDDRDNKGNLSRIELRKSKSNFRIILLVLISVVIIIAIFFISIWNVTAALASTIRRA
ncbi:hypothetical protein [Fructilactobacillus florum]|uniref:hypothetical protein n=1 Tax=Fructilactobacillus florum TaxID=640331 RepID=UPI00209325DD|nr:hypothetical protein [Fructilactobacillus florum]